MTPDGMTTARDDLGFEHVIDPGSGRTTLLLLHATGADEHQLVALGRDLAPTATLLSPRGKVLENGVTCRFFARHGSREFDIPDLLARTDELAEFVQSSVAAYDLNPARIVALGYSNGANMAASLLLRRPGVLAGAALLRATIPYEPEAMPLLYGTPVLIASGSRDPYVPRRESERLADVLRGAGAEVTYKLSDTGHGLLDGDIAATRHWLVRTAEVNT